MFCDQCGNQIQENQNFCQACGKPLAGIPAGPPQSRLQGHIKMLGILWLAISGFRLVPSIFLLGFNRSWHALGVPHFVIPLFGILGGLFLFSALLGFIAGWGLVTRQPWARSLSLVLGCLALLDPPFGTALGIYTLWVLLPNQSEQEYSRLARTV